MTPRLVLALRAASLGPVVAGSVPCHAACQGPDRDCDDLVDAREDGPLFDNGDWTDTDTDGDGVGVGVGDSSGFSWGVVALAASSDGRVDVRDVVSLLRFATVLKIPTGEESKRRNVASASLEAGVPPVATPTPEPPASIGVGDAILALASRSA